MDGRWFNGHYYMECYKSPVIFNSCLELTVVSYSQLCIPKWIHTHYAMQEYLNFRASWYPTSSYIPFKLLFWNSRNIHMCLMHPIIQRAHANVLLYTLNFSGRFTLSRSCTYAKLHHLTQFSPLAHKKNSCTHFVPNSENMEMNATHCGARLHKLLYLLHQQHWYEHVVQCQLHYVQCIVLAAEDLDKLCPV